MKIFLRIFAVGLALSFVAGCSGKSVCTDREFNSYLCDTADGIGVRLETVGNVLIVANAIAIGEGKYTAQEAVSVLEDLRNVVSAGPAYAYIYSKIGKALSDYPGLFAVSMIYLNEFKRPQIMTKVDREMLLFWIDEQIEMLGGS
jgi:hypothetical protein